MAGSLVLISIISYHSLIEMAGIYIRAKVSLIMFITSCSLLVRLIKNI
jgi:hypothetical protein